MPGLINLHHHIYSAFARGLSLKGYDPKGFLDILEGMVAAGPGPDPEDKVPQRHRHLPGLSAQRGHHGV